MAIMKKTSAILLLTLALIAGKDALARANNTESYKVKNNNTSETQTVQKKKNKANYSFTLFNFFNSENTASKTDTSSVLKRKEKKLNPPPLN